MSIINNGLLLAAEAAAAGGYQISRSLRFNSADSANCSRSAVTPTNAAAFTLSFWIKRSKLGTDQAIMYAGLDASNKFDHIAFTSGDAIELRQRRSNIDYTTTTSAVFRDCSAWYHIVYSWSSGTRTLYVNGVSQAFASNSTTTSTHYWQTSGVTQYLGLNNNEGGSPYAYGDYYLADIHFIDGQALTPSSFAETDATTGQWVPKAFSGGSYGTNGFRLTFSDNSGTTATTLGKDAAGSNNFTPNNFSVASGSGNDSLVDSPTSYGTNTGAGGEVRGNYATWNPLTVISTVGPGTLSNGNLDVSISGAKYTVTTILIRPDTGSYYWEVNSNGGFVAIYDLSNANTIAFSSYVQTQLNGLVGVALNSDTGAYTIYLNGSVSSSGTLSDPAFAWAPAVTGNGYAFTLNAGQRPFAYTAPSGFKALCDTNLPTPTIAKPSTVMDVKLYTGNGSTQTVSGLGFSPDLVWIKNRSAGGNGHFITDTPRFPAFLSSDATAAEQTQTGFHISALNSDGFSLQGNSGRTNTSGDAFAAWTWDAGTSTVTNTQGTISSQVRANASAGFSVVGWTSDGAASVKTLGHGLGVTPSFVVIKNRDLSANWTVYHSSLSNLTAGYLRLNTTDAMITRGATLWGSFSSTVFGVDQSFLANVNEKCIAYCFAPVAGYSAFGSYTGNGSADGPFVFCGFRPRWILIKSATETAGWMIYDTARDTYNQSIALLYPHLSLAEQSSSNYAYDIVSNGFKVRNSGQNNTSSQTYIYFAVAESPFQYARAR